MPTVPGPPPIASISTATSRRRGMNISAKITGERVADVRCDDATPEQRARWEKAGGGFGIHWPDIDEDLSTDGLPRGAPAPRAA